jgi:Flp pilus assembly pilin Flp
MKIRSKRGQAMAEYIIIVVVVALAALAIFGVFSDRLRGMLGGVVEGIGGSQADVNSAIQTPSKQFLQQTDASNK